MASPNSFLTEYGAALIDPQTGALPYDLVPFLAPAEQLVFDNRVQFVAAQLLQGLVKADGTLDTAALNALTNGTATSGGGTSTVAVTGVTLMASGGATTLGIGATLQLTATVIPSNATTQAVTFSSSDPAKATISSAGVVTGVAAGPVTLTVTTTDGNKQATVSLTVAAPAATTWRQVVAADQATGTDSGGEPRATNITTAAGAVNLTDSASGGQAVYLLQLAAGIEGGVRWQCADASKPGPRIIWTENFTKPQGAGFGNKAGLRLSYTHNAQSVNDGNDTDYPTVSIADGWWLFITREKQSDGSYRRVYSAGPNADGSGRTVLDTVAAASTALWLAVAAESATNGLQGLATTGFTVYSPS